MNNSINTFSFGSNPTQAFEAGGPLAGFEVEDSHSWDDSRVEALCKALGLEGDPEGDRFEVLGLTDDEAVFCHEDGRLAVVGLTVTGHKFAVEA